MPPNINMQVYLILRKVIIAGLTNRRGDPTYDLIAPHEGILLDIISYKQPVSMKELAALTGSLPNTMTGVVDRFVKRGILKRESSPSDRRIVLISLTEAGQDLHLKTQDYFLNFAGKLLDNLTAEEKRTLMNLLKRLSSSLDS
jgi:DNA-binding MarR family transcriptional regulator